MPLTAKKLIKKWAMLNLLKINFTWNKITNKEPFEKIDASIRIILWGFMKSLLGLKIVSLTLNEYHCLTITLSDLSIYSANISSFYDIYCYPSPSEWPSAFIGNFSTDIEWPSGFGIHLDQIVELSEKQDQIA